MKRFGTVILITVVLHFTAMAIQKVPPKTNAQPAAESPDRPAANSEPSLKETLDWLKEKISLTAVHYVIQLKGTLVTNMGNSKDVTNKSVPVRFESCTIVYESSEIDIWENFPKNPVTITTRNTVPIGELSEVKILKVGFFLGLSDKCIASNFVDCGENKELERWAVFLKTKSAVILQETHEDLRNTAKSESVRIANLDFSDEALAKRVADAFTHAAELCKGKEPF